MRSFFSFLIRWIILPIVLLLCHLWSFGALYFSPIHPEVFRAAFAYSYLAGIPLALSPLLLVFGFESCLTDASACYDTASLVLSVSLAAANRGLGTCQSTTLVRYPDLLREVLPGSDEKKMVVAMTLGWPDPGHAANTFDRSRAPLDELVTWVS